jgi:hypothetical protein
MLFVQHPEVTMAMFRSTFMKVAALAGICAAFAFVFFGACRMA